MNTKNTQWLLLIISLPTNGATARMRIWRALKSLGCGSLRDGVFLLPQGPLHQQSLRDLAAETVREGGSAWLVAVHAQSEAEDEAYRALFDRSADYSEFLKILAQARRTLAGLGMQEISRLLRKLRRDYEGIRAIDYFPNEASLQAEAVWMDFVNVAETMLSPDEPHPIDAAILQLDRNDYRARTWATRARLWVDRVASAWLILRFIDHNASFLWLDSPADCPSDALGFDFDGATFTHIGDRVTFEVLVASFGLESDRGLQRIGALVHALDVGGGVVPEASGFEAMLAGARQRVVNDDQLLAEIGVVLDSLYAHFSTNTQK
jgi:hypothetical protein